MKKSKRIEGNFTNKFGHVFKPGDKAIAVTTCTSRTHVARVEYVGYIERDTYNYQTKSYEKEKYVQIRRPSTSYQAFYKSNGLPAKWPYTSAEVEYKNVTRHVITTLNYNNILPDAASVDQLIEAV